MGGEKRTHPRVRSLNLVSLSKLAEEGYVELAELGRTLDLSEGGIRLEAYELLPVGTRAKLRIGLRESIIEVDGRIAYVERGERDRVITGIEFLNLSEEGGRQLRRLLSQKAVFKKRS